MKMVIVCVGVVKVTVVCLCVSVCVCVCVRKLHYATEAPRQQPDSPVLELEEGGGGRWGEAYEEVS